MSMIIKSPHTASFKGISEGTPARNKEMHPENKPKRSGKRLSHGKRQQREVSKKRGLVFTPWKVALVSILIGVFGILYINHIFTTQEILQEVNRLETEYNRSKRMYNEQRLNYDRLTGPKEIYEQARMMGFVNAGPASQILIVNPE